MNLYVNLPVADLARSRAFFAGLGFGFDDTFSDDTAIAMKINDACSAMLLTRIRFADFAPQGVAHPGGPAQVLLALQLPDRAAVDAMTDTAVATGGAAARPVEDHGFMYGRSFADPDGHVWEPFCLTPTEGATDA